MPYIDPKEIERVKSIDLLSYLQQCEPDELVRLGTDSFTTKTHDSLKLSNGCWFLWSQGFGGKNALSYLIKVKGMTFLEAVERLGAKELQAPVRAVQAAPPKKTFILPMPARTNEKAIAYLGLRGIDLDVICRCINKGLVYESANNGYANVVFVGKDNTGHPRYASIRGITSGFKGEAAGSDKRFSFRLDPRVKSNGVHIFESAIDALSFASLVAGSEKDWRELSLLSLGGIPPTCRDAGQTRLPHALTQYLKDNPHTRRVFLHLDNDGPGISAANMISSALSIRNYDVSIIPVPEGGTDINDYLMVTRKRFLLKTAPPGERGQSRDTKDTHRKKNDRAKER